MSTRQAGNGRAILRARSFYVSFIGIPASAMMP